jgi:hypothetical protein
MLVRKQVIIELSTNGFGWISGFIPDEVLHKISL